MSDENHTRVELLRSLLRALVAEWGQDKVREQLVEVSAAPPMPEEAHGDRAVREEAGGRIRSKQKPTASMMAEKANLPPKQKALVLQLATQFDDKKFLPTAGDIRYFFEVHGAADIPAKQRHESFRRVLRLLSTLEEGKLLQMIGSSLHSGPSMLGPLSKAMRGAGEGRKQFGDEVEREKQD